VGRQQARWKRQGTLSTALPRPGGLQTGQLRQPGTAERQDEGALR
jgi:hypothetical protein